MDSQEVHDKLEPRIRAMEGFAEQIKGATFIAKVCIAGLIAQAAYLFFSVNKDVGIHQVKIAALETQVGEQQKTQDRLRRNVVVLWDRQPRGAQPGIEAMVHHGRVTDLSATHITILPDDPGEPSYRFNLSENVRVRINEKQATIAQAKLGMKASVVTMGLEVTAIDFAD